MLERDSSLLHEVIVFVANYSATRIAFFTPCTALTAPYYNVFPSIMDASHSTVPLTVKLDPIPALVHGQSHQGVEWSQRDGEALLHNFLLLPHHPSVHKHAGSIFSN